MPLGPIIPEFLECSTEAAMHGRTVLQILQQHVLPAASPYMPVAIRGKELLLASALMAIRRGDQAHFAI